MNLDQSGQNFIKQLTDNFLSSVVDQIQAKATAAIQEQVDSVDILHLFKTEISEKVLPSFIEEVKNRILTDVLAEVKKIDLSSLVNDRIINTVLPNVELHSRDYANGEVLSRLNALNVGDLFRQHTVSIVSNIIKTVEFPENSISGKAINSAGLKISGDSISGGIIKNFESTGIQDKASACQVTILDDATVFENRLVSSGLEITGDTVFRGNIRIEGYIPDNSPFVTRISKMVSDSFTKDYDQGNFDNYCNRTVDIIKDAGLNGKYVKLDDDTSLVDGNALSSSITRSNLQVVGPLKELQVVGESYLDETLYVSNKRIGVNTLSPERTLDLWDHEVQIIAGKKMQDTAILGTLRNQSLILTANNKDQLTLNTDGSVSVKTLNIGKTIHISSNRRPTDNRPTATIVWNENPVIGAPVGWISLGGARWAAFGTIS